MLLYLSIYRTLPLPFYHFLQYLLPPANEVWGKVIFLHLSVILFTGGWYPSMHCRWYPSMPCSWGWYPSMHCRWYPSMPCSRGVPGPGGLVWGKGVPGSGGSTPGGGGLGCLVETPPRTATAVGGTHPTEMHSSSRIFSQNI